MEIDDETWRGLENPYVLLRPSDFQDEEEDIHLNLNTFKRAENFLFNPLKEKETNNQNNSYVIYKVTSRDGTILNSDSLGYMYEEHVEWLFPRAYQEKARRGNEKELRASEQ